MSNFYVNLIKLHKSNLNLNFYVQGVVEYSFSLFFTKLINYTFLYWLPRYIKETGVISLFGRKSSFITINLILGLNVGAKSSADLSTLFDIGGIFGGIIAGLISDLTGMSALTCGGSFLLTVPLVCMFYNFLQ